MVFLVATRAPKLHSGLAKRTLYSTIFISRWSYRAVAWSQILIVAGSLHPTTSDCCRESCSTQMRLTRPPQVVIGSHVAHRWDLPDPLRLLSGVMWHTDASYRTALGYRESCSTPMRLTRLHNTVIGSHVAHRCILPHRLILLSGEIGRAHV